MSEQTRATETELNIPADPEAVWEALTDPEQIRQWFSLEAEVEPGPGGSIWVSWGDPWEGSSTIELWEPGSHLRTGADHPLAPEGRLFVDWYLEGRGDETRLRIVHSGFGADEAWDDEYDIVSGGWSFFIRSLAHYLRHHRGERRETRVVRGGEVSDREAWWDHFRARLETDGGGDDVTGPAAAAGTLLVNRRPTHFAVDATERNHTLFFVELEPRGEGIFVPTAWISGWNRPAEELDRLAAGWKNLID